MTAGMTAAAAVESAAERAVEFAIQGITLDGNDMRLEEVEPMAYRFL